MPQPLYEVKGLSVAAFGRPGEAPPKRSRWQTWMGRDPEESDGWVELISDVSFSVNAGETLALVGESGSGKTLMLLGGVGLLPHGVKAIAGQTTFAGRVVPRKGAKKASHATQVLGELKDAEWREIMGTGIGVLFQDAVAAWDPTQMIGEQSGEVLEAHTELTEDEVRQRVLDALGEVRLTKRRKFFSFSYQMSRGEAQRAMLAAALLSDPKLLLADEPLSGLDATVASAVASLIDDLRAKRGMAMILVTHDLARVAAMADRVGVVYAGKIVELGPVEDIFHVPKHPYTEGLLNSMPGFRERLKPIEGDAPELDDLPEGCAYSPRCPYVVDRCRTERPEPVMVDATEVRCFRANELLLDGVG